MMTLKMLRMVVGLSLVLSWPVQGAFVLQESFEAQEPGEINGQRGWISQGQIVSTAPGNPDNQVLRVAQPDSYAWLSLALGKNPQTTIFFRVQVENSNEDPVLPVLDWAMGLSPSGPNATNGMDAIDVQVRQNRNPDTDYPKRIQVRDGDNYLPLEDLIPQVWYGVWLVCDAQKRSYQVYMVGGQFTSPTRLQDFTGQFDFVLPTDHQLGSTMWFGLQTGTDHQAALYLDDLYLDVTGSNLSEPPYPPVPPRISGIIPADGTRYYPASPSNGVEFTVSTTTTNSLPTNGIFLTLNGLDVSGQLDIRGVTTRRQVAFDHLQPNLLYQAVITVTDQAGLTTTVPFSFDTFQENSIVSIEAEHYNFQAGQFIAAPDLSSVPSASNYVSQVGIEGVDLHVVNPNRTRVYRTNDLMSSVLSSDAPRAEYVTAGVPEVDLGPSVTSEWLNYTRDFPSNYYHVYVRMGSVPLSTTLATLDLVTANAGTNNQTTLPLGVFSSSASLSTNYGYLPLSDGTGNPMVILLNGRQTLRLTTWADGFQMNYLALIPDLSTNLKPPYVSRMFPFPGATDVMPDTPIEVSITDRDAKLDTNTVRLKLDAREVTTNLVFSRQLNVTTVFHQPTTFLRTGTMHKATLIYGVLGAPATLETNIWWFSMISNAVTLPFEYALPDGSGVSPRGFSVRLVQGSQVPLALDTIERAELQLLDLLVYNGIPITNEFSSLTGYSRLNQLVATNLISSNAPAGYFTNDTRWITATNHANNLAVETVAYLALKRGSYRFGIYSERSFRLTSGKAPYDLGLSVTSWTNAVTPTETVVNVLAQTNGVYPFRLVWEQSTGSGNLEWYLIDPTSKTRRLINDVSGSPSLVAYRYANGLTNPLSIVSQPTNEIHAATQTARFSVGVIYSTAFPVGTFFQWQTNKVNLPGANHPTYTTAPLELTDDGLKFRCVITVPGFASIFSDEAELRVVDHPGAPSVLKVTGSRTFNRIQIAFSEPVEQSSAEDISHYGVTGGLSILAAHLDETGTNVYLQTSPQQINTRYYVTINGVTDLVGWPIAADTRIPFTSFVLAHGYLTRELFTDIPGTNVVDLTSEPKFQDNYPDEIAGLTRFAVDSSGKTNYGQRIVGYLSPPETRNYVFRLAASDSAELWLSTDENPTHTALIARVEQATKLQQWTNDFHQTSGAISLLAGQNYYLEVLHKSAATNDHVELGWVVPCNCADTNMTEIVPGDYLSTYVNPDAASITIVKQPQDIAVPLHKTGTFTVEAVGASDLGTNSQYLLYQWQKNGFSIPGAVASTYTTPAVTTNDNNSTFDCLITVPGKSVYTRNAVLTVTHTNDLPALFIHRFTNSVIVGWISAQTNIVLESNPALNQTNWVDAPEPVVHNGDTNQIIAPAVNDRFFRLRSP
jgi:hypothetical protein